MKDYNFGKKGIVLTESIPRMEITPQYQIIEGLIYFKDWNGN